ncbi:MAG TPA: PAS domain S-box protein [Syntrophorhabdus aromaticivorans]|nr:PAS domain S-box protein [Syntrophorhabdus aromaticivorans]
MTEIIHPSVYLIGVKSMEDSGLFALDTLKVAAAWIDREYIHKNANNRYCSAVNRLLGEVVGRSLIDIWGGETFDTYLKTDLDTCLSGHEVHRETSLDFPSLGLHLCKILYHPYPDTGGNPTGAIVMIHDLIEPKTDKMNLQASFENLTKASQEAIILVRDGVIEETGETFERLFGHPGEDAEGKPISGLIAPDCRAQTMEQIQEQTGGIFKTVGLRDENFRFPMEVNFRRFRLEGQELSVWAVRDLTKFEEIKQQAKAYQKHLEQMVKAQTERIEKRESKYRSFYENAIEGMFRVDTNGRLVNANAALARMYGYDRPEDLLEKASDLGDAYTRPKDGGKVGKMLQEEGVARDLETELYTKNGDRKWARMNVRAEKDKGGRILYYEGTLEDITEKKWAEDRYRNIFLNATEGIFQITPEGRCFNANPALARIHGFSSPEELMENATDISTQLHVDVETWYNYLALMEENGYVRDHLWKMYRKDGSIAWLSCNARVVRDETGKVLYHEGTIQDITEKRLMIQQILMQRDLALKLAQTGAVDAGLALVLEAAVKASGMESGGIWLKEPGEDMKLISSINFSPAFEKKCSLIAVGLRHWRRMMNKRRMVMVPARESMPNIYEEGYKCAAVIPILHDGQVIASFNLFSRTKDTISEQVLINLDFLAGQLGSIIVRMGIQQQVEQEIKTRREAEKALHAERQGLEEANIALKVLLGQREKDKEDLEQRFVSNVNELVLPYLEKLKKGRLEVLQRSTLHLIELNLKEILSPFRHNIRNFNLTPRQMDIVNLIKQGRTTKEIAGLLNTTKDAIDKQRFIIRKKLGVNKDKVNLRSLLLSFQ